MRLSLLMGVVAAAVLAATASSAFGVELGVFKVSLNPVVGSETFALKHKDYAGSYRLLGTPFGVATHVICKKVLVLGLIAAEGLGHAHLEFHECEVTKPANCTVKEPIEVLVDFHLFKPPLTIHFTPLGTNFTEITLQGANCAIKVPFPVTGKQLCNLPGATTDKKGHIIECLTTGSELKAGGKPATFSGTVEELVLEGEPEWSAE
jgi:hypothetical protein